MKQATLRGMLDLILRPGRDRSVRRRHPWILSGSVGQILGEGAPGAWVRVLSAEGECLGFGHLSPHSAIRVRLLSFGKEPPGEDLLEQRIQAALERRRNDPLLEGCEAMRLVNAEGDGLPGLTVDRYGDTVVARVGSAGMALRRDAIAEALRRASSAPHGYQRADGTAARQEGIATREGTLWGTPPTEAVCVAERGRRYWVDFRSGQKTGFYLDQREARGLVQAVSHQRRVLDLFCYSGGFAAAAALGGASHVSLVDSSASALDLARRNLEENAPGADIRIHEGNAFHFVRRDDARYDLVIIDPPPLARRRRDVPRAARAYKDVLMHALGRTEPGGLVLAFACSHHVGADLFRKIVFGACLDADRPARVLRTLGAPADHPVSIAHPEGEYLTGVLLGT